MDRETPDSLDPKGLIREAYRIEGIDAAQCRSVYLDWALSLPEGADAAAATAALLTRHGADADHPMTAVLREGGDRIARPRPSRGRRAPSSKPG